MDHTQISFGPLQDDIKDHSQIPSGHPDETKLIFFFATSLILGFTSSRLTNDDISDPLHRWLVLILRVCTEKRCRAQSAQLTTSMRGVGGWWAGSRAQKILKKTKQQKQGGQGQGHKCDHKQDKNKNKSRGLAIDQQQKGKGWWW